MNDGARNIFDRAQKGLKNKRYVETDNCATTTGRLVFYFRSADSATARLSFEEDQPETSVVIEHPYGQHSRALPVMQFLVSLG